MGPIATGWTWVKRTANLILPRGRFARGVSILAGGTALGQAVTVLVSPLLTRLYSSEDFGVFGVYAALLGIITVIASLRYEYALLQTLIRCGKNSLWTLEKAVMSTLRASPIT